MAATASKIKAELVRELKSQRSVPTYFLASLIITVLASAMRESAWLIAHRRKYDGFVRWLADECSDARPWMKETVLCQSAEGNWLARELIRVKLHERNGDHCDISTRADGCRAEPCAAKGLSSLLHWLARDRRSPVNKLGFLRPLSAKLRMALLRLAEGTLPLSELNKLLVELPSLARTWVLPNLAYPHLREWGLVVAEAPIPAQEECECAAFDDCACRFPYDMAVCSMPVARRRRHTGSDAGLIEEVTWGQWLKANARRLRLQPARIREQIDEFSLAMGSPMAMEKVASSLLRRTEQAYRDYHEQVLRLGSALESTVLHATSGT